MGTYNRDPGEKNEREMLVTIFRQELTELLGLLDEQIERLRGARTTSLIESLKSAMHLTHTIKGAAGAAGFSDIVKLTHIMEDAFGHYRKINGMPTEDFFEHLLKAITTIEHIAEGRPSPYKLRDLLIALSEPQISQSEQSQSAEESATPSEEQAAEQKTEFFAAESDDRPERPDSEQKRENEPTMTAVRVDVQQLDRLMNLTGEFLVAKARLRDHGESLEQLRAEFDQVLNSLPADTEQRMAPIRDGLEFLERAAQRRMLEFGHLTDELGETTRKVRMLPLNNYIPVWRRAVRESAQNRGKQVELNVEVGDIELDKTIFDGLRAPFLHLLRNAVDHGIEPPEQRARLGKDRIGRINIKASIQGATIRIDITDDGRGLSPKRIGEIAVKQSIITPSRLNAMTDQEIQELIFTPDFSTTDEISSISGRGVGMSIVKKGLASIGGSIVITKPGDQRGSAFRLTLPMSVLSIRGLLMKTENCTYAVPIENVERVETIHRRDCGTRGGTMIHERPGQEPLRLSRLQSIMGGRGEAKAEQWIIVIISHEDAHLGLIVDQLLGENEFVTKRLPWNVKHVQGVNGAVILGDGSLAVVVDVPYLFNATPPGESLPMPGIEASKIETAKKVLVVDDSLTHRTMTRTVLRVMGYEVAEAKDGEKAWELLQRQTFNLLVTDIQMPNLDGLQLTRRVRADQSLKYLPVILVSNLSSPDDLARGAAAGADEYIIKERFNQKSFLEAVARHI
jgi:chemotaxis protein histidine kinase CheA